MDLYWRVWHGSVCFFFKRTSCKGHFFLRTKNFFSILRLLQRNTIKKQKKKGGGGGDRGTFSNDDDGCPLQRKQGRCFKLSSVSHCMCPYYSENTLFQKFPKYVIKRV